MARFSLRRPVKTLVNLAPPKPLPDLECRAELHRRTGDPSDRVTNVACFLAVLALWALIALGWIS